MNGNVPSLQVGFRENGMGTVMLSAIPPVWRRLFGNGIRTNHPGKAISITNATSIFGLYVEECKNAAGEYA